MSKTKKFVDRNAGVSEVKENWNSESVSSVDDSATWLEMISQELLKKGPVIIIADFFKNESGSSFSKFYSKR